MHQAKPGGQVEAGCIAGGGFDHAFHLGCSEVVVFRKEQTRQAGDNRARHRGAGERVIVHFVAVLRSECHRVGGHRGKHCHSRGRDVGLKAVVREVSLCPFLIHGAHAQRAPPIAKVAHEIGVGVAQGHHWEHVVVQCIVQSVA